MASKLLAAIGLGGRLMLALGTLPAVIAAALMPQLNLTAGQVAVVLLAWLVGAGLVLRGDLAWVFGPVFAYDLVRTARNGRHNVLRCMYGVVLLVVLYLFFEHWFSQYTASWSDLFGSIRMPRDEVPDRKSVV